MTVMTDGAGGMINFRTLAADMHLASEPSEPSDYGGGGGGDRSKPTAMDPRDAYASSRRTGTGEEPGSYSYQQTQTSSSALSSNLSDYFHDSLPPGAVREGGADVAAVLAAEAEDDFADSGSENDVNVTGWSGDDDHSSHDDDHNDECSAPYSTSSDGRGGGERAGLGVDAGVDANGGGWGGSQHDSHGSGHGSHRSLLVDQNNSARMRRISEGANESSGSGSPERKDLLVGFPERRRSQDGVSEITSDGGGEGSSAVKRGGGAASPALDGSKRWTKRRGNRRSGNIDKPAFRPPRSSGGSSVGSASASVLSSESGSYVHEATAGGSRGHHDSGIALLAAMTGDKLSSTSSRSSSASGGSNEDRSGGGPRVAPRRSLEAGVHNISQRKLSTVIDVDDGDDESDGDSGAIKRRGSLTAPAVRFSSRDNVIHHLAGDSASEANLTRSSYDEIDPREEWSSDDGSSLRSSSAGVGGGRDGESDRGSARGDDDQEERNRATAVAGAAALVGAGTIAATAVAAPQATTATTAEAPAPSTPGLLSDDDVDDIFGTASDDGNDMPRRESAPPLKLTTAAKDDKATASSSSSSSSHSSHPNSVHDDDEDERENDLLHYSEQNYSCRGSALMGIRDKYGSANLSGATGDSASSLFQDDDDEVRGQDNSDRDRDVDLEAGGGSLGAAATAVLANGDLEEEDADVDTNASVVASSTGASAVGAADRGVAADRGLAKDAYDYDAYGAEEEAQAQQAQIATAAESSAAADMDEYDFNKDSLGDISDPNYADTDRGMVDFADEEMEDGTLDGTLDRSYVLAHDSDDGSHGKHSVESDPFESFEREEEGKRLERSRRRCILFVVGWIVVVALIAAAIGVGIAQQQKKNAPAPPQTETGSDLEPTAAPSLSPSPTSPPEPTAPTTGPPNASPSPTSQPTEPAPTSSPTPDGPRPTSSPTQSSYYERRRDVFQAASTISGPDAVSDPAAPQGRAARWMADDDSMQMEADDPGFVQRYSVATAYFATTNVDGGSAWKNCGAAQSDGGASSPCDSEEMRWLSGSSECGWYGVECENSQLTSLNLRDNGLDGTIAPEFAQLTSLRALTLSRNGLGGTIPSELGEDDGSGSGRSLQGGGGMKALRQLNLARNALTGTVPPSLGALTDLMLLAVGNNEMSGTLPPAIFGPSLQYLDVGDNSFRGALPSEMVDVSKGLIKVDLTDNELTGSLPLGMGELTALEWIKFGNNRLTGQLEPSMFGPALQTFDAEINELSGALPVGLFANSPKLTQLNLGKNSFSGPIPDDLGELADLELLLLYLNSFTGTVPSGIGKLNNLLAFDAGYNYLGGTVPASVCLLTASQGGTLAHLATDCDASADGGTPLVECPCCTHCYVGYGEDGARGGGRP